MKEKFALLAQGKWIYILALPGITWFAALAQTHPETNDLAHDWVYFIYWLFFVLAGFICITQPKLMDSLERNRRFALTIGFLSFMLIDYLRWNNFGPLENGSRSAILTFFDLALRPLTAWAWVLALIGYGKKYLNRKHKSLNYLNQAVYPFYILHQTVIVVITYYIVQLHNESILSKYIYTIGITFFVSMGIYHLLIQPYALMRILFGMKPKNEVKPIIADDEPIKQVEIVLLSA